MPDQDTVEEKKRRVYTILHCENLLLEFLPCPLGPDQAARLSFGSPKEKEKKKKKVLGLNLLPAYSFFPSSGFWFDSS
jgi:hypothetical protein